MNAVTLVRLAVFCHASYHQISSPTMIVISVFVKTTSNTVLHTFILCGNTTVVMNHNPLLPFPPIPSSLVECKYQYYYCNDTCIHSAQKLQFQDKIDQKSKE